MRGAIEWSDDGRRERAERAAAVRSMACTRDSLSADCNELVQRRSEQWMTELAKVRGKRRSSDGTPATLTSTKPSPVRRSWVR